MTFVEQGESIPHTTTLPDRLLLITLLELLGYFLAGIFIGIVFGPAFKTLISSS